MEIRTFDIAGPLEIIPHKLGDERGYFAEIWRADAFAPGAGASRFVQENQSLSASAGTIRGLHFQVHPAAQGKLVRCIQGAIHDVVVDLRHDSPTFGRWLGVDLTPGRLNQMWVPPGFAHGFCTLEPGTIVTYKVTGYYSADHDLGLAWDDPAIGVIWPAVADPGTLSPKDRTAPLLSALPRCFSMGD